MAMHAGSEQWMQPDSPAAQAEIRGQLEGYWIEPGDELPEIRPSYDPTGAVLLESVQQPDRSVDALDLMEINGAWCPLSHAAVLTYLHTSGMAAGETWYFVCFAPDGSRSKYICEPPLMEIAPEAIAGRFGTVAAHRARPDWPSILVRLRPVDVAP